MRSEPHKCYSPTRRNHPQLPRSCSFLSACIRCPTYRLLHDGAVRWLREPPGASRRRSAGRGEESRNGAADPPVFRFPPDPIATRDVTPRRRVIDPPERFYRRRQVVQSRRTAVRPESCVPGLPSREIVVVNAIQQILGTAHELKQRGFLASEESVEPESRFRRSVNYVRGVDRTAQAPVARTDMEVSAVSVRVALDRPTDVGSGVHPGFSRTQIPSSGHGRLHS
jgi:hypothetical protein